MADIGMLQWQANVSVAGIIATHDLHMGRTADIVLGGRCHVLL